MLLELSVQLLKNACVQMDVDVLLLQVLKAPFQTASLKAKLCLRHLKLTELDHLFFRPESWLYL